MSKSMHWVSRGYENKKVQNAFRLMPGQAASKLLGTQGADRHSFDQLQCHYIGHVDRVVEAEGCVARVMTPP